MIVNLRMLMLPAVIALVLPHAGLVSTAGAEEGRWSKQAFSIPFQRAFRVPSPDRKKVALISDRSLAVISGGEPLSGLEGYPVLLPAEISWSPDSKAFVITSNEGGSGDEAWFVTVFVLDQYRVDQYDITAAAADRFREQMKCPDAGEPHFGAVKWLKGSKDLLVAAEVPEQAACPGKGAFRGYVIEVPSGKVVTELDPKKLSDDWGEYLGSRFAKKTIR